MCAQPIASPTTTSRPSAARARVDVAVASAVLVLPILVALVHAWSQPWVPSSDDALIELRALDVPSHLPLVGVYSRYKFHHPGPVLFFVDALPVRLFGPHGLLLASAIVNAVALVGLAWLMRRRGGRVLLVMATVVLLTLVHALADQLLDPWNPWITTLPFTLFVVAVWSVACRDWWGLPIAAAAGSFVVQAHLAFGLLVAVLLVPALVFAVVARVRRPPMTEPDARPGWVVLALTALVLVGLWIPPLVDQVVHDPGNLTLIAQSVQEPTEPPAGAGQAWDVIAHSWGTSAPWITAKEPVEPFSGRVSGASWWTLLPTLAVVVAALALSFAGDARRDLRVREARRGEVIVLAACGTGFVSIVRITGNALPYLVRWTWALAALLWLLSAWLLTVSLQARALPAVARMGEARVARPALVLGAAVILAGCVLTAAGAASAPLPDAGHSEVVLGVVDAAVDQLRAAGTVLVRREGSDYGEVMQGVAAELERRGVAVRLLPDDAFLVGDHRVIDAGAPHATLYVVTTDGVAGRLASGEKPLAAYDQLSPAERTEFDALQRRGQLQYLELLKGVPATDPLSADERARLDALTLRADRALLYLTPPTAAAPPAPG